MSALNWLRCQTDLLLPKRSLAFTGLWKFQPWPSCCDCPPPPETFPDCELCEDDPDTIYWNWDELPTWPDGFTGDDICACQDLAGLSVGTATGPYELIRGEDPCGWSVTWDIECRGAQNGTLTFGVFASLISNQLTLSAEAIMVDNNPGALSCAGSWAGEPVDSNFCFGAVTGTGSGTGQGTILTWDGGDRETGCPLCIADSDPYPGLIWPEHITISIL
jgi:hypothetical protein